MKLYILIIYFLFGMKISFAQNCEEFQTHLNAIDSTYFPGSIIDRMDTTFNANRAFVNYTIDNLLIRETDKCFISNRNLLRKLNTNFSDSSMVVIQDSLKNGNICKITIETAFFKPNNHQITFNQDSSNIKEIDNQFPYGGQYSLPKIEISQVKIEVNGVELFIPTTSFGNLFNPNLTQNYGFIKPIEAFESLDGEYIYLYIYGGNAAGTYFSKLIFDKTKYVTKIVSDYYPLSIYSSFRKNFIGY